MGERRKMHWVLVEKSKERGTLEDIDMYGGIMLNGS
jgi:hypothetical protein